MADLKKHQLKRRTSPPNFPKLPTKFSFQNLGAVTIPPPVVTSTCPALMTWSRSNSAHGTVTGTAKPYLGSPFICDPSWLGSFEGGWKLPKNDDHLHENWVVGWFLEFFMGCVISYRFGTFTCPVFADYFELVDSSIFRINSYETKQQISAGEITQCRIICVTCWWKLAQVRVFFFDENKLEEVFSQSRNHRAFVLAGHLR